MPMTGAERRKKDRIRKARQRAAAAAAGIPPHHAVLNAIVEGTSFHVAGVNIGRREHQAPVTTISVVDVMRTAVAILSHRGYDAEKSGAAVKRLLAPRPEHRMRGYVPSHSPLPHQPVLDEVAA